MSDPFRFTQIAHAERAFLGPYDAAALHGLAPAGSQFILDIGCGKGAALEALGGKGVGIEHNAAFADEARERNPEAEIWVEDAKVCLERLEFSPELILCLGASQAIGTPAEAVARLTGLLAPGGQMIFGDGYWRRKPEAGYLEFFGCEEGDMMFLDELAGLGEPHGLEAEATYESTEADWAAYEDSYHASVLKWCDENPDDPDAEPFRARITGWRNAYLKWGHDTLGLAMVRFRKR